MVEQHLWSQGRTGWVTWTVTAANHKRTGEGRGGKGREGLEGEGDKRLATFPPLSHDTHTLTIATGHGHQLCDPSSWATPTCPRNRLVGSHEQSHRRMLCRGSPKEGFRELCSELAKILPEMWPCVGLSWCSGLVSPPPLHWLMWICCTCH